MGTAYVLQAPPNTVSATGRLWAPNACCSCTFNRQHRRVYDFNMSFDVIFLDVFHILIQT